VTFIATVIAAKGAPTWLPDPTVLFTFAGIVGIAMSITGNESAQRWGRARVVTAAMSAAAALSLIAGLVGVTAALAAVVVVMVWNAAIYFDSSALTAGTVQAAGKGVARCDHGPAQHVRLCRRLYRPAWGRSYARPRRQQ
jgi:hypothetical protein